MLKSIKINQDICGKLMETKSDLVSSQGKSFSYSDIISKIIAKAEELARKNGFKDLSEAVQDLNKQGVIKEK